MSGILIKINDVRSECEGSQNLVDGAAAQYNASAMRRSEGANGGHAEEVSERTWTFEVLNSSRALDTLSNYRTDLIEDLHAPCLM